MGAAEVGPSKLRLSQKDNIHNSKNYSFLQESIQGKNHHKSVGDSFHISCLREIMLDDPGFLLKFCFEIHLESSVANNPPMGLAFDRRGNQGGGDVRGAVLNTTEQGAGGGERTRPLIYLFAPLLFQALEKKAKRVQKGEKGYHESTTRYKRRICWRI